MTGPYVVWIEDAFGEWRRHEFDHQTRRGILLKTRPEDRFINAHPPHEMFLKYPEDTHEGP